MSTFVGITPTGNVDGVNAVFTVPTYTSIEVYVNGQLQTLSTDYILGGTTVTFVPASIPQSGDILTVWVFNQ
jgi:hypothetical protein